MFKNILIPTDGSDFSEKVVPPGIAMARAMGAKVTALHVFPTHHISPYGEFGPSDDVVQKQMRESATADANKYLDRVEAAAKAAGVACDRVKDHLTKSGLSFKSTTLPVDSTDSVITKIDDKEIRGWNAKELDATLKAAGYPASADKAAINYPMTILILFVMMLYVTMVYGPIAAFLVELFPTQIRYTSMSLPYHIGNGWFGGMLPLLATAMVAASGNIYYGLWYPIGVAMISVIVGALFLHDNKDRSLEQGPRWTPIGTHEH